MNYTEILKVWNMETPDDFAIFSELYYQMFGEDYDIPYTTDSTCSAFFPYTSWQGGTQVVAMPPPIPYIKRVKQTQHQMRKIEQQMNNAISNSKDWRSANTEVVNCNGESFVYLHGNHIATVGDDFVRIFDGGWQSNTTKSRLNAILHEFAYGVGVFQKNWEWFVCNNNKTEDFINGMEIAF